MKYILLKMNKMTNDSKLSKYIPLDSVKDIWGIIDNSMGTRYPPFMFVFMMQKYYFFSHNKHYLR